MAKFQIGDRVRIVSSRYGKGVNRKTGTIITEPYTLCSVFHLTVKLDGSEQRIRENDLEKV